MSKCSELITSVIKDACREAEHLNVTVNVKAHYRGKELFTDNGVDCEFEVTASPDGLVGLREPKQEK